MFRKVPVDIEKLTSFFKLKNIRYGVENNGVRAQIRTQQYCNTAFRTKANSVFIRSNS